MVLFLFPVWGVCAQDLIVKHDASKIEARVLEITLDEVSYKRFSNPDGPTYRLPVSEIRYIEYPNGERDTFRTESEKPESEPKEHSPAGDPLPATADTAPAESPSAKSYAIGDLYDVGGVKGIVLHTTDEGRHGLVISLEETTTHWDLFTKEQPHATGAADRADGEKNMAALERYIADKGLNWSDFPAAAWCRSLGEGWYLPAIDELLMIAFHFNGDNRTTYDRKARQRINNQIKEHGGKRLDRMMYYYSSSEEDALRVLIGHMDTKPPYVEPYKKNGITCLVRAVHKF